MAIDRLITNLVSDDLPASRAFWVDQLGFSVAFEADWYLQVTPPGRPELELAFWAADHELVPEPARTAPAGVVLTVVLDDVDAVHDALVAAGTPVRRPPLDTPYGQRSLLVDDPNGVVVDISSPVGEPPE